MSDPFAAAAAPVLDFIAQIDGFVPEGERSLLQQADRSLSQFEAAVAQSAAPTAAIKPARYALAMLIDQRVRQHPQVRLSTWAILARKSLFEDQDIWPARIAEFQRTAETAGPEFADLAAFLGMIRQREGRGGNLDRSDPTGWRWKATAAVVLFCLGLAGYAAALEYRFHARITERFNLDLLTIGLDRNPAGQDLAQRLTKLAEARDRVLLAVASAPFRRVLKLPLVDSEDVAGQAYLKAVEAHVPTTLAGQLESVIATEGDGLKLYDALRAWSVLSGEAPWEVSYLTGWMADHERAFGLPDFSRHVATLDGPIDTLTPSDPEVFAQARDFAAETSEVDRVWQELWRAGATQALPGWRAPLAVPGVEVVLQRRSGQAMGAPIPGLFTREGWAYARDFGIGIAVRDARALAPSVIGGTPQSSNDTPDRVQDRLHAMTLGFWQDWLSDLRVRPFADRDRAIRITGSLSQRNNPLTELLRTAWAEVGGMDRARSHAQQLELARSLGPIIQYIDGPGMTQITQLFSRLNVALGSLDIDSARGLERLMSLHDRARSINILQSAPTLVVQIAEDVLAHSSAAENGNGSTGINAAWQGQVYAQCRKALDGRYPFDDGPDADPGQVAALLAPSGAVMRFFSANLDSYIDRSASPWRWKPEARFQGLTPESAAFFEVAVTVSQALFDEAGQMHAEFTLAALAERGATTFALGGMGVPLRASGDPAALHWPGPDPSKGVQVSFREATQGAHIDVPGHWGLHRMLDRLRLRFRDQGARVLVDLRSEEGRVFVEIGFAARLNLISGRSALQDFSCPPSL